MVVFNYAAVHGQHGTLGHGISYKDKEILLEKHDYKCDICGDVLDMTTSRIDHDHITGKYRGILCNNCNSGLGMFFDNLAYLYAAVEYVEKFLFEKLDKKNIA